MSINIKRLQRWRTGKTSAKSGGRERVSDLPLDRQLTFNPDPTEEWKYRDGRIFINDEDVGVLINEHGNDIGFLSAVNFSLDSYKQFVWGRGGMGNAKFNGAVDALQGKIVGRFGSIYEGLVGGVRYEFTDNVFWINNVNVKAVIALYRMRPTSQAKEYLKGLRTKLFLIIARQQSNPRVNGIHGVVHQLIGEINGALKRSPPADTPLLVADTRAKREHAG